MGCGTGCGCGPVYVNEVARMRDTIALMRETNMFSPGEVLAIKEAVDFYEDKEFHQHQTPTVPDEPSRGGGKLDPQLVKGWSRGYEVIN